MAQTGASRSGPPPPEGRYGGEMKRAGIVIAGLIAVLLILFYDSAASMVRVWETSATFSHGFLIPPIVAYLFWYKRDVLAGATPRPSFWGIAWISLFALIWLLGQASQTNLLQHLGLVGMLQGAVVAVLGPVLAYRLMFPLGYMLFMVPFGDFAIRPLQAFTAEYTTSLLRLTGVPVLLENWVLSIPGGSFLVAEACSGVQFLIACIALGVLIAGMFMKQWWKRLAFIVLSIVVPILANVLRAYGIVMIAHLSDFELAVGVDHIVFGFVFLSFVMGILIAIGFAMRDTAAQTHSGHASSPQAHKEAAASVGRLRAVVVPIVALVLFAGLRSYATAISAPSDAKIAGLNPPAVETPWAPVPKPPPVAAWRAYHPKADAEALWRFSSPNDEPLSVYIAFYADETGGKELISHHNRFVSSDTTDVVEAGRLKEWRADVLPPPAYRMLRGAEGRRVVWFWYAVDGKIVTDPLTAKLLALRAKLLGGSAPSAIVAISARAESFRDTAMLEAFLAHSTLAQAMRTPGLRPIVRSIADNPSAVGS